ncbi:MAG TPA: CsbD family protein [Blastocatellia bacterium]|nr:CsbD family protein [Blastocatellia bacterium]
MMWNKDELEGKGKKIKGAVKDKAGEITGNRELETEGKAERAEGHVQEQGGRIRRKTGEAIEDVGKAISGKK